MKRKIDYLRISVTDRCNLRCRYCMPEEIRSIPHEEILRYEEIIEIVRAGAAEGIRHVRVTGGEPLVRKDVPELIRGLKEIPGIETAAMTTNGILLSENISALKGAGIDGINISLDTADPEHYESITGCDGAKTVLRAVADALSAGICTKINVAVMEETSPDELLGLVRLAKDLPVYVRFIEMMPIGYGARFRSVDNEKVLEIISEVYPDIREAADDGLRAARRIGYGPARYFEIPGFQGQIGFISAIHNRFCDTCNRLRLTSTGFLKYCLCYGDGEDLRGIVRSGAPEKERSQLLRAEFRKAAESKPEGHQFLIKNGVTEKRLMSGIGG